MDKDQRKRQHLLLLKSGIIGLVSYTLLPMALQKCEDTQQEKIRQDYRQKRQQQDLYRINDQDIFTNPTLQKIQQQREDFLKTLPPQLDEETRKSIQRHADSLGL